MQIRFRPASDSQRGTAIDRSPGTRSGAGFRVGPPLSPRGSQSSRRVTHLRRLILALLLCLQVLVLGSGCGALLPLGGAGTSAIAFATGELRSTEEIPLSDLDVACGIALETLGYDEIEAERNAERVRWKAVTAGGDPVDLRLKAKGPKQTELRIRVGVFGDEARSRLVLEQIHQSL